MIVLLFGLSVKEPGNAQPYLRAGAQWILSDLDPWLGPENTHVQQTQYK